MSVTYHMTGECYKKYTRRIDSEKLECSGVQINENITTSQSTESSLDNRTPKRFRSHSTESCSRASKRFSEEFQISCNKCIICAKFSHNKDTKLHSVGEERAKILLRASRSFADDIFTRTCTLNNVEDFVRADLKYHSACMRSYQHKYEKKQNTDTCAEKNVVEDESLGTNDEKDQNTDACAEKKVVEDESLERNDHIISVIKSLESRIYLGETFSLSDLSNLLAESSNSNVCQKCCY